VCREKISLLIDSGFDLREIATESNVVKPRLNAYYIGEVNSISGNAKMKIDRMFINKFKQLLPQNKGVVNYDNDESLTDLKTGNHCHGVNKKTSSHRVHNNF
jgi:hypothetical protein